MKRGKVKKGKNDLMNAEDGDDPYADISSVGKTCFVCLSLCMSVGLPASLSVYLPDSLSVCLSVYLYACLSVCRPASLSVCLPVCLSVCDVHPDILICSM